VTTALLMLLFLLAPIAVMAGMSLFRSIISGIETTPSSWSRFKAA